MRGILQFAAIVAVMVAARYVPAGDALRWLVKPASKPVIETGSIQDQQTGNAARDPMRRSRDAAADVRAILAQASGEKASNNNAPQRRPARSRASEDEMDDDGELYIGGTGLIDEDQKAGKEHPLAAKHPEDYLVICEAGCRPLSDRIVYRISRTSAVNAEKAQRKLQVTSGAEGPESNENGEIVCIAGCYDEEPVKQRRAESVQAPAVRTAESGTPSRDQTEVEGDKQPHAADAPKAVALASPPAPETTPAAPALDREAPASAAMSTATGTAPATASTSSAAVVETVVTAVVPPSSGPPSSEPASAAPQPAVIAEATSISVREIAAVHAISAEAAARREAKRAAHAAQPHQSPWQTQVTSLVVLRKPAKAARSVVALSTLAPFETSVAVEHGWDFTLSNTP